MLVLAVSIVLAVLSAATFPCWSYSARWGYTPSVIAGMLLFCVAIVIVAGKYAPKAAEPNVALAAITPACDTYSAYRRTVDAVILAPDDTHQ